MSQVIRLPERVSGETSRYVTRFNSAISVLSLMGLTPQHPAHRGVHQFPIDILALLPVSDLGR